MRDGVAAHSERGPSATVSDYADRPESSTPLMGGALGENGQVPSLRCLLCGGLRHCVVFSEGEIDIVRCRECQHVFSSYAGNPHYDGYWGEEVADEDHLYWRDARQGMYQDFIKKFLAGRSGRLLDMGCGLGFFPRTVSQVERWEAYGCEISQAAVRYAQSKLGLSNIVCSRLDEVDLPRESFDVITMWDVIDHILRPDPLLGRCHALLRDGGICFIRTPNVSIQLLRARIKKLVTGLSPGVSYLQARNHAHHYSMSSIRKLLRRNGFERVEFVHLRPVQAVNDRTGLVRGATNASFQVVRALAVLSGGRLNFDNLFVVAFKGS